MIFFPNEFIYTDSILAHFIQLFIAIGHVQSNPKKDFLPDHLSETNLPRSIGKIGTKATIDNRWKFT